MTVTAAALLAGGAFGVRHALEADHVAAVATLVERGEGSAATGAAWGVGHSVPLLAVGGLFVALDVRLPGTVATAAEALAGLVLVALGLRALAGREALGLAVLRHVHGADDTAESGRDHPHVRVADRALGLTHSHADGESFAVGVVHGLAGSGGVVVVLAGTAPTVGGGAAFLAGFAAATVAAMGLAAWGWGRAVGRAGRFRIVAGVASVAVGLLLIAETAGVPVPL